MLYVFTSATGPSVTYTGAIAEEILRQAGKTPGPRGVIVATEIDSVLARLRSAATAAAAKAQPPATPASEEQDEAREPPVPFDVRLLPFFDLLERARAAGKDVTWGI